MDEITSPAPPIVPDTPNVPSPTSKKGILQLFKDSWKSLTKSQKYQMVGVLALVLGLPTLLGSVYAVKLYRSGAATPPVTPPTSPTPTPVPARQSVCGSASISSISPARGTNITIKSSVKDGMTANYFSYPVYNLDNLYGPANPKPVCVKTGGDYTGNTASCPSGTYQLTFLDPNITTIRQTGSRTVSYANLFVVDASTGKALVHAQILAYFELGSGPISLPDPKCVVYANAAGGTGTPTPTPKPTCVPKPTCPKGASCMLALPPGGWCLPTPTPKPTPTPSPRLGCGSICQKSAACAAGLICYQPPMPSCPPGRLCSQVMPAATCRNPSCPTTANCLCGTPTPRLTPTPMADCYTCNQNHQCVFGVCVSGVNSCNPNALNPCPTPTGMPAPTPQPACRLRIFGFCLIY